MKRYDPTAERERLEKSIHDLTNRMLEIGFILDDDSISDSSFSRLEKEEIEVIAKIGKYQTRADFLNVRIISSVNDWTAEFLESFEFGTRKVSNRQADCLRRVNNGKPFIYKGRRYDCRGANYRAGFGTLIITDLEGTEIWPETETAETAQQEEKAVCFHCGNECHANSYPETVFSGEGIHICEECSIDFETVCGVPVPRFVEVLTYEKIGVVIEALKKAVAPPGGGNGGRQYPQRRVARA